MTEASPPQLDGPGQPCHRLAAVTIISTSRPCPKLEPTAARAGGLLLSIHAIQTSVISSHELISCSQICAESNRLLSVPASARYRSIFVKTCSVWPLIPCETSSAVMPDRKTRSPNTTARLNHLPLSILSIAIGSLSF